MTADDFPKDITEATITGIDVQAPTSDPGQRPPTPTTGAPGISIPAPAPTEQDHAGIALLDIAIAESVKYCEKEGYPAPNTALWDGFSRGFLNKALWHYFPSGTAPESPAVCALIGVAGLAVCYTPVILAFYEKKQKEAEAEKRKQIDKHNRKTAALRAAQRQQGAPAAVTEEDTEEETEEPEPIASPDDTPTHDPTTPTPKPGSWFMTTAPALSGKLTAGEPEAPGMS